MENDTNKQLLLNEEVKQTLEEAQQTPEDAQQTLEDAKQNCTDDISNILLLGCEEKLLSKEDVEKLVGAKLWIRNQPLISKGRRHLRYDDPQYQTISNVSSSYYLFTSDLEPQRPRISADQQELHNILQEWGYMLERSGNSGFASRCAYVVSKKDPQTQKIKAPLVTEGGLEKEDKIKFGLEPYRGNTDHYVVWTGKLYEGDVILESEITDVKETIQQAKKELENRRTKKVIEYINEHKNGDISILSIGGGPESFSQGDIPENYEIVSERRTACTADHRRNMTHTYELVILDKKLFENKSFVKIKVPDQYKGIIIGKGGSKIKELSEKFRCKIKVE